MVFQITLLDKNDQEFRFPCTEGQTVAEAAEAAGHRLVSCSSGYCGACYGKVIAGSASIPGSRGARNPDTRDILLCQCVPESDLVIKPRFGWVKLR